MVGVKGSSSSTLKKAPKENSKSSKQMNAEAKSDDNPKKTPSAKIIPMAKEVQPSSSPHVLTVIGI
jgi:hypothetical protein